MLDLIIILILLSMGIVGFKRGFAKTLMIFPSLFSVIVSWVIYPIISKVIMSTQLCATISRAIEANYIAPHINDVIAGKLEGHGMFNLFFRLPFFSNVTDSISQMLTQGVTMMLINVSSIFISFVVCKLILRLLTFILSSLSELPVLKQIDKLGGVIFGFIKGAMLIYLSFTLVTLFVPLDNSRFLKLVINNSKIIKIMQGNNIIMRIFASGSYTSEKYKCLNISQSRLGVVSGRKAIT